MEGIVHSLRDHWEEAVAHTRGRSPGTFDRWFSALQFNDFTDGVLSLRARDLFVRDWVCEHYLPSLVEELRRTTELSIQIAWSIGEIDRPIVPQPARDEPTPSSRPSPSSRSSRPSFPRPSLYGPAGA